MGTNKIICLFILCVILLSSEINAQTGYVPSGHPVYDFLERMDAFHIIGNYHNLEKPRTRSEIAAYISEAETKSSKLTPSDRQILEDLKTEFEFELKGTLIQASSFVKDRFNERFSGKEKYLFAYNDTGRAAFFINLLAEAQHITRYDMEKKNSAAALLGYYGGSIRGSLLNRFSFFIRGINGRVWGDSEAARLNRDVRYNFKYNTDLSNEKTFYDLTEGYFSAEFDFLRFKIGRDQLNLGYGPNSNLLSYDSPQFDYLSLSFRYKLLDFSFFHGKLLGRNLPQIDSVQGVINSLAEKYLVYHRMGFNISRDFSFGLGEMLIYSNRSPDLSYLNPFNFYKTAEHANQDRDNSLIFFDAVNNSVKGMKLFVSLLIDDMDFGKIGTKWYGNQTSWNISLYSANLYEYIPVDFYLQYMRAEPYMYTHRISENNFTTGTFSLTDPLMPNSYRISFSGNYRPHYRVTLSAGFSYMKHGANPRRPDGSVVNVGGDVNLGFRMSDNPAVTFLDGDPEHYRSLYLSAVFEPFKNYYISYKAVIEKNSLQNSLKRNFMASYFVVNVRI